MYSAQVDLYIIIKVWCRYLFGLDLEHSEILKLQQGFLAEEEIC